MKVYLIDEKTSVELRLLYDILWGLKALCGISDYFSQLLSTKTVKTKTWVAESMTNLIVLGQPSADHRKFKILKSSRILFRIPIGKAALYNPSGKPICRVQMTADILSNSLRISFIVLVWPTICRWRRNSEFWSESIYCIMCTYYILLSEKNLSKSLKRGKIRCRF